MDERSSKRGEVANEFKIDIGKSKDREDFYVLVADERMLFRQLLGKRILFKQILGGRMVRRCEPSHMTQNTINWRVF